MRCVYACVCVCAWLFVHVERPACVSVKASLAPLYPSLGVWRSWLSVGARYTNKRSSHSPGVRRGTWFGQIEGLQVTILGISVVRASIRTLHPSISNPKALWGMWNAFVALIFRRREMRVEQTDFFWYLKRNLVTAAAKEYNCDIVEENTDSHK